jgi:hypothetical protein
MVPGRRRDDGDLCACRLDKAERSPTQGLLALDLALLGPTYLRPVRTPEMNPTPFLASGPPDFIYFG